MREQQRPRLVPAGPSSGGLFGGDGLFDGEVAVMATVQHGPYLERLPVVNMTVAEVRERFRDRLDIHPDARAVVDGNFVSDDTAIGADDLVTFVRPAGAKG